MAWRGKVWRADMDGCLYACMDVCPGVYATTCRLMLSISKRLS